MKINAVIFDMDGLMFDTERLMKAGWEKASREMGFTLTEYHLSQMRGGTNFLKSGLTELWTMTGAVPSGHSIRENI